MFDKKYSICYVSYCKFHSRRINCCEGDLKKIINEYKTNGCDCPRDNEDHRVVRFEEVRDNQEFFYLDMGLTKNPSTENSDVRGTGKITSHRKNPELEGSDYSFLANTRVEIWD
jgi:hypothetical protein